MRRVYVVYHGETWIGTHLTLKDAYAGWERWADEQAKRGARRPNDIRLRIQDRDPVHVGWTYRGTLDVLCGDD